MPKITISMGLNIPISRGDPEKRFDRFTPAVTIAEIDTDGDINLQIESSLIAAKEAWKAAADFIEMQCTKELGRNVTLVDG